MPRSLIFDGQTHLAEHRQHLTALRTPLDAPILLMLLMLPISLWASFDLAYSAPKLGGLLLGVALCYATVAYVSGLCRLRSAIAAYLVCGLLVGLVGLFGTQWLQKSDLLWALTERLPRLIRGLPGAEQGLHPNEVAGVLIGFVPLQLALASWFACGSPREGWKSSALGCSVLLCGCTLVLTQSRGALFGLAVGLLAMGSLVDRRVRLATAAAMAVGVGAIAVTGPVAMRTALVEALPEQLFGELNWGFRLSVWRAALWGMADFPFTGMGLGTFRHLAPLLYPLENVQRLDDLGHAHNGFLQAALDLGLVGLVAYAGIWLQTARMLWRTLQAVRGWPRAVVLGICGCFASSLVFNLTDTIALGAVGGVPWWFLLGLAASVFRLAQAGKLGESQWAE